MNDPNLYGRIKDALVAVLKTLNLPGIKGVFSELAEDEFRRTYPCLTVTEEDCTVKKLPGDSRHRDSLFPIRVFVETSAPRTQVQSENTWLVWLKTVTDRFQQYAGSNKLPNVTEVYNMEVTPLKTWDFKDKRYQRVRSGIEIGFYISEPW